jgi:hypothetical protein
MKLIWCWRCKIQVPMLDEKEFAIVSNLYSQGMEATKEFRQARGVPLSEVPFGDIFRPVRAAYEKLTGMKHTNHDAVMHHRISIYGRPCTGCGKPLRTPNASSCAACGRSVSNSKEA